MDTDVMPQLRESTPTRVQRRRAGKACQYCHARKIRCDVQRRGSPCSNCVIQSISCEVRRRKNARSDSNGADECQRSNSASNGAQIVGANRPEGQHDLQDIARGLHTSPQTLHFDKLSQPVDWTHFQDNTIWDNASVVQNLNARAGQTPSTVDYSYLSEIEDLFAFTDWSLLPAVQQSNMQQGPTLQYSYSDPGPLEVSLEDIPEVDNFSRAGFSGNRAPNANDQQYLRSQGCFTLPPVHILRHIMNYYFRYVHPNLPIVDEYRFASLWEQEDFRLDGFSFFVFRAMMFVAIHFVDLHNLATLGYPGKKEARVDYLRHAKLAFDFSLETDTLALAQGCLLLTYYAPGWNKLRVNGSWLMNAARFARMARADTFHLVEDPVQKTTLKRLWWGIIFRDRILSMGLRWTHQVELNPRFKSSKYFLDTEDFSLDLGRSKVHDQDSQIRIIDIVTSLCSLVCELTPALHLLYGHERVRERVADVANSVQTNITHVRSCLDGLHRWYERTIPNFPDPISLDDTHDSICIYANLLFCYYSSAVFALNLHRILIHVTIPTSREHISLETCRESSVAAINDVGRRTQELVQTRLAQFLPISVSAYMALPLLLQAVDVAAVRGTELEAAETRKLDIFSRVLRSQEQNFDGPEFCREILSNIVAHAQNDQSFFDWVAAWRDERRSNGQSGVVNRTDNPARKTKLGWANLILKRPHLYLRLLLNLDFALCTGSAPKEEDLLPEILHAHSPP